VQVATDVDGAQEIDDASYMMRVKAQASKGTIDSTATDSPATKALKTFR